MSEFSDFYQILQVINHKLQYTILRVAIAEVPIVRSFVQHHLCITCGVIRLLTPA